MRPTDQDMVGRIVICIGLGLALTGCGTARPAQPGTGIQGTVQVGPTCPVERINSPCPPRYLSATVVVRDGAGREVTRVHSSNDGRFKVDMPAGSYTLIGLPLDGRSLPRPIPTTVAVTQGSYASVIVRYDSGIR
jgi:hypothetical protein